MPSFLIARCTAGNCWKRVRARTAEIVGYILPDGQDIDSGFSIAKFDESAIKLAGKEAVEGGCPTKLGDRPERSSGAAAQRGRVGDTITLTLLI